MAFWQGLFVLSLVAAVFVVWPLIKFPFIKISKRQPADHDETQAALYEEHLEDLEKSHAAGDIDDKQFAELKLELQKTLVLDGEVHEPQHVNYSGKKLLLAFGVVVPVVSVFLYTQLGAKPDWEIYQQLQTLTKAENQEEHTQALKELTVLAEARINQRPENLQLLNLSAQSSMALQDYDKAVDSYEKILAKAPKSPQIMANLAQAMFYRAGYKVTPEVRQYIQDTLKIAPMMPEMLGLAGIDAKNQGNYEEAIRYWSTAVAQLDPNSNAARSYQNGILKARQALAAQGKQPKKSDDSATGAAGGGNQVTVKVSLAEGVQVAEDLRVFVYARAWQGSPMPLAIKGNLTVKDLPISVTLDETMAMSPAFTITSAPKLEVVARVSKNGTAASQSGDWQAAQGPVTLSDQKSPISLVISEKIP